jgi:hypothetical protein
LQIKGRAADDLEHVAGRGLVFERLLQVVSRDNSPDRVKRLAGAG